MYVKYTLDNGNVQHSAHVGDSPTGETVSCQYHQYDIFFMIKVSDMWEREVREKVQPLQNLVRITLIKKKSSCH